GAPFLHFKFSILNGLPSLCSCLHPSSLFNTSCLLLFICASSPAIFPSNTMSVTIHTTIGDVKIEVFCDTAPRTAFNFLALCASGYYDGTAFHRNMKGFMIQGGDPNGTGKGGESIWGGKFNDEFHADNKHDVRGQVSMANTGINTNGSQFFITYERQPHLNNVYTVFGRVLDGWDTLDQMERLPVEGEAATKKRNKFRPINRRL
ncbi:peptidyl-prolyl cis-trans isomerase, cyclophilin type, partial [Skeletonema marinoi]